MTMGIQTAQKLYFESLGCDVLECCPVFKTRIKTRKMTSRIFNVENPFNVKAKKHEIKPENIFTI